MDYQLTFPNMEYLELVFVLQICIQKY